MNEERSFERFVADRVAGQHSGIPLPDDFYTDMHAFASSTRQRPEWLAFIKEPPMRTNSHLAVGSPTVRVIAVLAATFLLIVAMAAAGAGVERLLAAGPIVVAQDGSGTYETITEAVATAEDGDEILVRPGTYAEAVTIEKDIILRGDGPVEDVVVELADAVLFTLTETDAEIADLTLRGDELTQGMQITGGAPTIRGLVFDGTGTRFDGEPCFGERQVCGGGSLALLETDALVTDNRFIGGGEVTVNLDANTVLEGNELLDGPHIYLAQPGDGAVVRDNIIRGTVDRAIGLFAPSTMAITGNTIEGAGGDGITVGWQSAVGYDPLIEGNVITGSKVGVWVIIGSGASLVDNEFVGNETAVLTNSDGATFTRNRVSENDYGFVITGAPQLEANEVLDGGVGIRLTLPSSKPVMTGNTVCGNEQNVLVNDSAEPLEYDDTNEICADAV